MFAAHPGRRAQPNEDPAPAVPPCRYWWDGDERLPHPQGDRMTVVVDPRINCPPPEFRAERDLPAGFMAFYAPLDAEFSPRQRALAARREEVLSESHAGRLPGHLAPSDATRLDWRITLPSWCLDQRNQMT